MILLTVFLTDGRELSGRYHYLEALSRLAWARELPEYAGFDIGGAV